MAKSAELKISGIKCDNPKCNYQDKTVKFEDYKNWVNKPCPKCGTNLLTEIDFINTSMLMALVNSMNKQYPDGIPNEGVMSASVKMDGTGKIEFDINNEDKRTVITPPENLGNITRLK